MAALSFGGISTGLPTEQLVQAILQNEYLPLTRLQTKQSQNNQRKSALNSIKTALTSLSTSVSALAKNSNLEGRKVTSSDGSYVSATATAGAKSGSYDITVDKLASKARLEMSNTLKAADIVGKAGDVYTITNKDGESIEIEIGATDGKNQDGNITLAELSDKINAAKLDKPVLKSDGTPELDTNGNPKKESAASGVTSSVVQTKPGEYKLVLSATDTGAGDIFISNTPKDISDKGHLLSTGDFTAKPGENAEFTVNGVAMERASNTVSDAVDGVTFTLNKADKDKTINLNVTMDTDSVVKAFQDVIDKYNVALQVYKNNSGSNGSLANDSTMRTMFSQIKSALSGAVTGADGSFASAASLGMSTKNDGALSLDANKLREAIEKNPDLVKGVFDQISSSSMTEKPNSAKNVIDRYTSYGSGGAINSLINSIETTNSTLAKQIETLQGRLDRRKEALTAQFARLESAIGQMQAAGQSLSALSS